MELLFLGLGVGATAAYFIFQKFANFRKKNVAENQSITLLDKIRRVAKLITVEGEFAEIYHHEDTRDKFLGLISSKKKAIVIINAKTHIGFDFRKIKMDSDAENKKIIISNFPEPEVLSIEPNIRFYDIKEGFLNKFSSEDLTKVNAAAREHVLQKIPETNLMEVANNEALEAILLMQSLVETIGWKLDYSSIELPEANIQQIKDK